ncbi:hypothetical protein ACET3Z_004633 [Daucus carota]
MVKKEKRAKEQSKESLDEKKHINESPALLEENPGIPEPDPVTPADTIVSRQTGPQPTESSTQSKKRSSGAARGVCAMHKVVMKKAKGEKLNLRFNQVAVPVGDERHKLQSYIGMLARTMVPIEIFGIERTIYLLEENVLALLEFRMIGQSAISTYMAYLYSLFRDTPSRDLSAMFSFLHPSTYKLNDEFNDYVVQRLKDGVLRMNFLPFNYKYVSFLCVLFYNIVSP